MKISFIAHLQYVTSTLKSCDFFFPLIKEESYQQVSLRTQVISSHTLSSMVTPQI